MGILRFNDFIKTVWKAVIGGIVVYSLISGTVPAFAEGVTPAMKPDNRAASRAARMMVQTQDRLSKLKVKGDKEIDRRVARLNALVTRINAAKRITADQKSALVSQVQVEITTLGTLRAKIDADTDIAILRTDVQSIVKEYRVFVFFVPKMEIIANSDKTLEVIDLFSQGSTNLQTRMDAAKAAGKDTSVAANAMADRTVKLADARTQTENAISTVTALTPDGYPGNKTVLQSARGILKTARTDLQAANKDGQQIRQILSSFGQSVGATPTGTR